MIMQWVVTQIIAPFVFVHIHPDSFSFFRGYYPIRVILQIPIKTFPITCGDGTYTVTIKTIAGGRLPTKTNVQAAARREAQIAVADSTHAL